MVVSDLGTGICAPRFGNQRVVWWSGVAATLGIGQFALAGNTAVAFAGAALSGVSVAIVYPLAMSAETRI